jgi:hypothetical protein
MTPQPSDWRELAEKASKEMDPEKLELLIDELNRTLERDIPTTQQPDRSVWRPTRRIGASAPKKASGAW